MITLGPLPLAGSEKVSPKSMNSCLSHFALHLLIKLPKNSILGYLPGSFQYILSTSCISYNFFPPLPGPTQLHPGCVGIVLAIRRARST